MKRFLFATVAVGALAGPALAQQEFAPGSNAVGIGGVNDAITDVYDDVHDDFARSSDSHRYGIIPGVKPVSGSFVLSYTGSDGNNENQNFSVGGRLSSSHGNYSQTGGILLNYSSDDDGKTDERSVDAIYDGQYYFTPSWYGFVLAKVSGDGLVNDKLDDLHDGKLSSSEIRDLDGRVKEEAFFGIGPGYRVINEPGAAWRVQAGIGGWYTNKVDYDEPSQMKHDRDTALVASSRLYYEFGDKTYLTNDTDYLKSQDDESVWNELAVNYKFTDAVTGRISYQTEYVAERAIRTDNKLGMAAVFSF